MSHAAQLALRLISYLLHPVGLAYLNFHDQIAGIGFDTLRAPDLISLHTLSRHRCFSVSSTDLLHEAHLQPTLEIHE